MEIMLILALCILWWVHEIRIDRYKKRIENLEIFICRIAEIGANDERTRTGGSDSEEDGRGRSG